MMQPPQLRHAGDNTQDPRQRDELTAQDEERAHPQQDADEQPLGGAEAVFEVVAHRAQVVAHGDAVNGRADPEGQRHRSDRRRADPPPRGEPVAIAEAGGAHGRSGADVRRQHRREHQARAERAAGHEEAVGRPHLAADPQAQADDAGRIGQQHEERRRHRGLGARLTAGSPRWSRSRSWRACRPPWRGCRAGRGRGAGSAPARRCRRSGCRSS